MSDRELEAIKRRKLAEMQKRLSPQQQKKEPTEASGVLNRIFRGRAWEVFNTARAQFPDEIAKVEQLLVSLAEEQKIAEIDGEHLYALLREIGLPVRMNTTIKVVSHGEAKSLSEKMKER